MLRKVSYSLYKLENSLEIFKLNLNQFNKERKKEISMINNVLENQA